MIKQQFDSNDEKVAAVWLQERGYVYTGHFWSDVLSAKIDLGSAFITNWEKPSDGHPYAKLFPLDTGWVAYLENGTEEDAQVVLDDLYPSQMEVGCGRRLR